MGYSEDETRGRSFSIIYTPEDQRRGVPERELRAAAEEGRAQDERWHVRKDGTRLWASGVVTPLLDKPGGLRGFAKVMRDFTEHRRAEEALRMSEARFRTMVEQSPLSIQILSPDGRTVWVNRAWEKLWGVTLEGLEGYNLLEDRQLVERGIMPYIRRGFAREPTLIPPILYDPEETIPGKRSHEKPKRWVRAFIYPVKDEAGNVREVVLIHEDITERKQAEEALREMRKAERRIARDLHDGVLQDLSYTAAATALIKRKVEGSELQEHLQGVIDAVKRAAQGLRDAVDDLRLKEAHDHRLLLELVEPLVQKNRALAKGSFEVNLAVEEGFPSTPLGKTATELLGILQEAPTNIRRHSGAKNVWVTLKTQGSEVIAEVLDDGRGFGPETAPGVGLSSMHERAAVVGGKLKIESAAGQGTRVQLRVPAPREG